LLQAETLKQLGLDRVGLRIDSVGARGHGKEMDRSSQLRGLARRGAFWICSDSSGALYCY
jgi:hypothetical protein